MDTALPSPPSHAIHGSPPQNVWMKYGTILQSAGTLPRKLSSTTNKTLAHRPAAAGTAGTGAGVAEARAEAEVGAQAQAGEIAAPSGLVWEVATA